MAIAPINKVSFRSNYNQVNFEGKKKEHTHSKMTNALKSVPLATLIAMSPLNMQAEDVVVARVEIENADAITGQNARVLFCDTDGNPSNVEKIVFEFEDLLKYKEKINGREVPVRQTFIKAYELDSVRVEKVTEVFDNEPDRHSTRYYISGPTTSTWSNSRTADVPYEQSKLVRRGRTEKYPREEIQVTQRVYDYLKQILGSQLPEKVTTVTEDGDLNYREEMGEFDY